MRPYSEIPTVKCERIDAGDRLFRFFALYVVAFVGYAILQATLLRGVLEWPSGPQFDNNFDVLILDLARFPLILTWAVKILITSKQQSDKVFAFGVIYWGFEFVLTSVLSFFAFNAQQVFVFLGPAIVLAIALTNRAVKGLALISTILVVCTQSAFAVFAFNSNFVLTIAVTFPLFVLAFSIAHMVISFKTTGPVLPNDWCRLASAWSVSSIAMLLVDMTWLF